MIPPDSVVFPKRGAAIATNKKRLTTMWTVLDPNLIAVRPHADLNSMFFYHWTERFDLRTITDPGCTPQLNKKDLIPVLVPVPASIEEQRDIATALNCVGEKIGIHHRKCGVLRDLFRTLLRQLMTAQIRVLDLDMEAVLRDVDSEDSQSSGKSQLEGAAAGS
jgi:type I restriction enzyme S subunit